MAIKNKKNGFAIIFVLAFIALILTVIGDILYQTQIVAKNTMQGQNQIDAESTSLTGIGFGKLLINFNIVLQNLKKQMPKLSNSLIGLPSEFYTILNGMPVGANTIEMTVKDLIEPEILDALKPVKGEFTLNVRSENSKFNLNLLNDIRFLDAAETALTNLFSTPYAKKILDLYGFNNPSDSVSNLIAYINGDERGLRLNYVNPGGMTFPPPKHGPLTTVDELRRIPGFNYDDIYNMYAPYFTVWPTYPQLSKSNEFKFNINNMPIELLASLLTPPNQDLSILEKNWHDFDKFRKDSPFSQIADVKNKIHSELKQQASQALNKILDNIVDFEDKVYSIESVGIYNKTTKKLFVVIERANSLNPDSEFQEQSSKNFHTLFNQWID